MTTEGKLPFTGEFQSKALGLMLSGFESIAELDVKPEYFDDPVCAEVCENILDLKKEFGLPVTMSMLEERLRQEGDDERLLKYSRRVALMRKTLTPSERKYLTKGMTEFVKYQSVRSALSSAVDYLRKGDVESVEGVMNRAFQVGKSDGSIGLRYFTQLTDRLSRRRQRKVGIRTLITELDTCLDNHGLNLEELGCVLAPTKRGKSFFLCHVAKAAVIQKQKCVYYTMKMSEDRLAERLDASFTGIEISELRAHPVETLEKLQQLGRRFGDSLIIKRYPAKKCSVGLIKSHLDRLSADDFYPKLVVIDYGDLLSADLNIKADNRYYELGNVYEELKSLAQERSLAIWTASQATRGGYAKELLTLADVAESFQKVMISDVIISLNQTPKEKQSQEMRLFVAGSRNARDEVVVPILTNFAKGAFYRKR